jgi:hypothetical protein
MQSDTQMQSDVGGTQVEPDTFEPLRGTGAGALPAAWFSRMGAPLGSLGAARAKRRVLAASHVLAIYRPDSPAVEKKKSPPPGAGRAVGRCAVGGRGGASPERWAWCWCRSARFVVAVGDLGPQLVAWAPALDVSAIMTDPASRAVLAALQPHPCVAPEAWTTDTLDAVVPVAVLPWGGDALFAAFARSMLEEERVIGDAWRRVQLCDSLCHFPLQTLDLAALCKRLREMNWLASDGRLWFALETRALPWLRCAFGYESRSTFSADDAHSSGLAVLSGEAELASTLNSPCDCKAGKAATPIPSHWFAMLAAVKLNELSLRYHRYSSNADCPRSRGPLRAGGLDAAARDGLECGSAGMVLEEQVWSYLDVEGAAFRDEARALLHVIAHGVRYQSAVGTPSSATETEPFDEIWRLAKIVTGHPVFAALLGCEPVRWPRLLRSIMENHTQSQIGFRELSRMFEHCAAVETINHVALGLPVTFHTPIWLRLHELSLLCPSVFCSPDEARARLAEFVGGPHLHALDLRDTILTGAAIAYAALRGKPGKSPSADAAAGNVPGRGAPGGGIGIGSYGFLLLAPEVGESFAAFAAGRGIEPVRCEVLVQDPGDPSARQRAAPPRPDLGAGHEALPILASLGLPAASRRIPQEQAVLAACSGDAHPTRPAATPEAELELDEEELVRLDWRQSWELAPAAKRVGAQAAATGGAAQGGTSGAALRVSAVRPGDDLEDKTPRESSSPLVDGDSDRSSCTDEEHSEAESSGSGSGSASSQRSCRHGCRRPRSRCDECVSPRRRRRARRAGSDTGPRAEPDIGADDGGVVATGIFGGHLGAAAAAPEAAEPDRRRDVARVGEFAVGRIRHFRLNGPDVQPMSNPATAPTLAASGAFTEHAAADPAGDEDAAPPLELGARAGRALEIGASAARPSFGSGRAQSPVGADAAASSPAGVDSKHADSKHTDSKHADAKHADSKHTDATAAPAGRTDAVTRAGHEKSRPRHRDDKGTGEDGGGSAHPAPASAEDAVAGDGKRALDHDRTGDVRWPQGILRCAPGVTWRSILAHFRIHLRTRTDEKGEPRESAWRVEAGSLVDLVVPDVRSAHQPTAPVVAAATARPDRKDAGTVALAKWARLEAVALRHLAAVRRTVPPAVLFRFHEPGEGHSYLIVNPQQVFSFRPISIRASQLADILRAGVGMARGGYTAPDLLALRGEAAAGEREAAPAFFGSCSFAYAGLLGRSANYLAPHPAPGGAADCGPTDPGGPSRFLRKYRDRGFGWPKNLVDAAKRPGRRTGTRHIATAILATLNAHAAKPEAHLSVI